MGLGIFDGTAMGPWVPLFIVSVFAGILLIFDHGEAWETVRKTQGKQRAFAFVRLVALWGLLPASILESVCHHLETNQEAQKLGKMDPLDRPIKFARAFIKIEVSGDFDKALNQGKPPSKREAKFGLTEDRGYWLFMTCEQIEVRTLIPEPHSAQSGKDEVKTITMVFNWPDVDDSMGTAGPEMASDYVDSHGISTRQLDASGVFAALTCFGFPEGMKIISSKCEVVLNGSISRSYANPKITRYFDTVEFYPETPNDK